MESYFGLSMQFLTQSEPAYCGLGTLCMVLNALEIDPLRQWKGVWRWYDESMLDCCRALDEIKRDGITLGEFQCIANCNGLKTQVMRADRTTKDQFIACLKQSSREADTYMVVSYHRATLQQTGDGHFSPIGGYNEKERMVLILDVARFKYPVYWVSVDLLFEALYPIDTATGKPRGFVLLSKGSRPFLQSVFSQLAVTSESWPRLSAILFVDMPKRLSVLNEAATSLSDVISLVIASIPDEYDAVVENRIKLFLPPLMGDGVTEAPVSDEFCDYIRGLDILLKQIGDTELYRIIFTSMENKSHLNPVQEPPLNLDVEGNLQAGMRRSSIFQTGGDSSRFSVSSGSLTVSQRHHLTRSLSRRESYSALIPPNHQVDDFCAFLCLFLFALCSFNDIFKHLPPNLSLQMKHVVGIPASSAAIQAEVILLRDQISAFMRLEQEN